MLKRAHRVALGVSS